MKNRLIENYATSIIGLLLLGAAGYFTITGHSYETTSAWFTLGVTFLRSKDSIIGLEPK
jgi:hypothetical protein